MRWVIPDSPPTAQHPAGDKPNTVDGNHGVPSSIRLPPFRRGGRDGVLSRYDWINKDTRDQTCRYRKLWDLILKIRAYGRSQVGERVHRAREDEALAVLSVCHFTQKGITIDFVSKRHVEIT